MAFWNDADVNMIINHRSGDRKVRSAEELEDALRASVVGLPAIKLWIHEALQEEVRTETRCRPVAYAGAPALGNSIVAGACGTTRLLHDSDAQRVVPRGAVGEGRGFFRDL